MSNNKTTKLVSIFRTSRGFLLNPYLRDENGIWLSHEPFICLPLETSSLELVQKTDEIFQLALLPQKDWNWQSLRKKMLKAAKFPSERQFHSSTKAVGVSLLADGAWTFVPKINGGMAGPHRGYHPIIAGETVLSAYSQFSERAQALTAAFNVAT